jgi:hypothetical protein
VSRDEKTDSAGCVPASTADSYCSRPSLIARIRDCEDPTSGGNDCSRVSDGDCGGDDSELLGSSPNTPSLRSRGANPGTCSGSDGDGVCLDGYTAPVTRSPGDPWHSQEYLLKCLIRHHGWWWKEAGVLARPWHRQRVHCFEHPEGL